MSQILFTNVNDSGDAVLVFTNLTPEILQAAYAKASAHKITYDECYAIPEGEEGFYLWEPCWLTAKQEAHATALATA